MAEPFKIPLRNQKKEIVAHTLLSEEDFERANKHKWYRATCDRGSKVKHYARSKIKRQDTSLHKFLMGAPPEGMVIDHKNGDGLDNRRENLRFATRKQNGQNRIMNNEDTRTSNYVGVSLVKRNNTWAAFCSGRSLGNFKEEKDAAIRYDSYVLKTYGRDALCNNLVRYEDVENVDIEDFLPKARVGKLPKNIRKDKNRYFGKIFYKSVCYKTETTASVEEAQKELLLLHAKIEKIKEQERVDHSAREIERNKDGIAVIKAYNRKGELVKEALVDDDVWHELKKYGCSYGGDYFILTVKSENIPLHVYIKGAIDGKIVDHINHDKTDNRKSNLRHNDSVGNNHNHPKRKGTTSEHKGVNKVSKRWSARISKDGKSYHLGTYEEEIQASIAYNLKAKELYGDFANQNNVSEEDFNKYQKDVWKNIKNLEEKLIIQA